MGLQEILSSGRKGGSSTSKYVGIKFEKEDAAKLCEILGIPADTPGATMFKVLLSKYVEAAGIELD